MKKFLPLLLCCIIYIIGFLFSYNYIWENLFSSQWLDSLRNIIEYTLMFAAFIVFNTILWKNKWTRILSILLLVLLTLNFSISISCYYVYQAQFNIGMAVSIIDTNPGEVWSMASMFAIPTTLSLIFLGLLVYCISSLSKYRLPNYVKVFSLLWIILPLCFFLKHKFISNKGGGFMIKNVVYHAMDFYRALDLQKEIENLQKVKVNFNVKKIADPTETIVVVIGESVRADHMSLYGYKRSTTSFEDQERANMYLYKNAVSPASITNLSVPLVLSNIDPQNFESHNNQLANNLINLANHQAYKTFWYSTQGGAKSITAIANFAQEKRWITGYDEALITYLDKALQQPGKKFIVLHLMGSHPNPCDKYPENAQIYKKDNYIDCYDNSIQYTDKVLGQIFSKLKQQSSVLFYLSDHGLKLEAPKFIHGDYLESTKVPFYIWNSPLLQQNKKMLGESDALTQTTILYPLIMQYMGLQQPAHYKNEALKFLKLDLSVTDYNNLNP